MSTSGMHRRPFEGRHLVSDMCLGYFFIYLKYINFSDRMSSCYCKQVKLVLLQKVVFSQVFFFSIVICILICRIHISNQFCVDEPGKSGKKL